LIQQAIVANAAYLQQIADALAGHHKTFQQFLPYRRKAEISNQNAFLSLRRMQDEPEVHQVFIQNYFILLGHQIRITRILNTLAQYLRHNADTISSSLQRAEPQIHQVMHTLHELLMQSILQLPLTSAHVNRTDQPTMQLDTLQHLHITGIEKPDEVNQQLQLIHELIHLLIREVQGTYQTARALSDTTHTDLGISLRTFYDKPSGR